MKKAPEFSLKHIWIGAILIALIFAYCGFSIWKLRSENASLKTEKQMLQASLDSANQTVTDLKAENKSLADSLSAAQDKISAYSNTVDNLTNAVDSFQRLAKTDKELLQKYSKVFFLNENYVPSALTDIDTKYLFNKNNPQQIHDRIWPFLASMIQAARDAQVDLSVSSAYRSFKTQAQITSRYKVIYGAGTANTFSADQGYSEHQLGTTLDLTTAKTGAPLTGFEKTPAYAWMTENAYKYGFILSYPPKNAYYVFEPWHWRFVGIELAKKLHDEKKNFYDLDQREINTFLLNIFSNPPVPR